MKGGRNTPKKSVSVAVRVPQNRRVEPPSPHRSADEALLDLVLGRASSRTDEQGREEEK